MAVLTREAIEQDVDLQRVLALLDEWRLETAHMAERVVGELHELRFEVSDAAADLCHITWAKDLGPIFAARIEALTKMQGIWKRHMMAVQKGRPAPVLTAEEIYLKQVGDSEE